MRLNWKLMCTVVVGGPDGGGRVYLCGSVLGIKEMFHNDNYLSVAPLNPPSSPLESRWDMRLCQ